VGELRARIGADSKRELTLSVYIRALVKAWLVSTKAFAIIGWFWLILEVRLNLTLAIVAVASMSKALQAATARGFSDLVGGSRLWTSFSSLAYLLSFLSSSELTPCRQAIPAASSPAQNPSSTPPQPQSHHLPPLPSPSIPHSQHLVKPCHGSNLLPPAI